MPDVRHVVIPLARLPAELDGLRLVQISDLHASSLLRAPWVGAVVASGPNGLNPDLLLVTGDLIDGTTEQRAPDVASLRALKARLGVFAIPGNHEYYSRYEQWIPAFRKLGLHMLLNEQECWSATGAAPSCWPGSRTGLRQGFPNRPRISPRRSPGRRKGCRSS